MMRVIFLYLNFQLLLLLSIPGKFPTCHAEEEEEEEEDGEGHHNHHEASTNTQLIDAEVSYVIEPFEAISVDTWDWYRKHNNDQNNGNSNFNVTINHNALFGNHALQIDSNKENYDQQQQQEEETLIPFVQSILSGPRAHNCHDAEYFSLWYKYQKPSSTTITTTGGEQQQQGGGHFRVILFDDACHGAENVASMGTQNCPIVPEDDIIHHQEGNDSTHPPPPLPPLLRSTILLDQIIVDDDEEGEETQPEDWTELRMYNFGSLNLNRIKGWKLEVNVAGSLNIDHLACVGGGSMLGAAFYSTGTMEEALEEGSWQSGFYLSEISKNSTTAILRNNNNDNNNNGNNAQLNIEYTIEQVENWGGFLYYSHLAPGVAYYNLSQATNIMYSYNVLQAASVAEHAHLRIILTDSSHCLEDCDLNVDKSERWYSFHSILDQSGPGEVLVPLIGSTEPSTPFWHTGWSGITGNAQLDLATLKGFTIEFSMDERLGLGSVISGSIVLFNFAARTTIGDNTSGDNGSDSAPQLPDHPHPSNPNHPNIDHTTCMEDTNLHFIENAPQFRRLPFLAGQCCEICANDPECLYATTTGFGHCFIASSLDPRYVRLSNTKNQQTTITSVWMDDAEKRGDFCNRCTCQETINKIDCQGADLAIVPKTFTTTMTTTTTRSSSSWSPKILDLRNNPKLFFLGSNSLDAIGAELEEILLPKNLRHIAPEALENLPNLKRIRFEGYNDDDDDDNDDNNNSMNYGGEEVSSSPALLNNVITDSTDFFSDVCCSRGQSIELESTSSSSSRNNDESYLTFCNMQVSVPGVDTIYEDFIEFIDPSILATLTPSSDFMAEAAESPEKCAQFCTISAGCRFFHYDGRVKNSEHICYLLQTQGRGKNRVCCNPDHFADEEQTLPGWVAGRPPLTRHELDDAKLMYSIQEIEATEETEYEAEYEIYLGSTPLRGAVWITPSLVSSSLDFNVSITPSRVVLYDDTQSVTVRVKANGIIQGSSSATIVIQNMITSCDEAFLAYGSSTDNSIYIYVAPASSTLDADDEEMNVLLMVIISILSVIFLCGGGIFVASEWKRRQNDNVWKVPHNELTFSEPPEIIGRGSFGLVLLAEYRGTKVAIKRVLPPSKHHGRIRKSSGDTTASHEQESNTGNGDDVDVLSRESTGSVGVMSESKDDATDTGNATQTWSKRSLERMRMLIAGGSTTKYNRKRNSNGIIGPRRQLRNDFIAEMRQLSALRHPCITTVMGAVMDLEEPMLVMEYMDHGSLHDILHNETLLIEGEILLPILCDISKGLRFLHSANPQVIHGDLKTHNILVDNRFRAKVADFGLSQKKVVGGVGTPFWMAPELLKGECINTAATDVFSFGILLYEVYSRRDPYEGEDAAEVLKAVMDDEIRKRPPIPPNCPPVIATIMTECLRHNPEKRPTFEELHIRLMREEVEAVNPVNNADGKASQISLFDIFPRHIAEALRDGRTVEAEHREMVTIFFSDIVGFTKISANLPPRKVANMLDRLYTKFDALSREYDVFKVETIGDAYMAVTNLVKDQSQDHAKRIAQFAIRAVEAANETCVDEDDPERGYVNIRVGFHSGSVVADVVGTRNPRYCLFGDTVNTASRMESSSKSNRIHCSTSAAELLVEQYPELPLKPRGRILIKGKGEMHTFWVNEKGTTTTTTTTPEPIVDPKRTLSHSERTMLQWARTGTSSRDLMRNGGGKSKPTAAGAVEEQLKSADTSETAAADIEMPILDIVVPLKSS